MTGADAAPRVAAPGLPILIALTAVSAMSLNLFLPSLNAMATEFGVNYPAMALAVSAYLAASAVVQFAVGPISDRLGRRPVMLAALGVFVLASLGCLWAPGIGAFLVCRLVQSAVTAGMVLPRAIIRDTAPPGAAASRIGYVMTGMSVVPMIAPAIGGMLDHAFGWRASFVLLAALGAGILVWTWRALPETAPRGGIGFRAQMAASPALLRSGRFWAYAGAATFASGTFYGYLGGAAFVGSQVFHMPAAAVGWWFMAPSLGYFVGNFIAGRWSGRVGIDRMVLIGAVVTLAGTAGALGLTLAGMAAPLTFFGGVAVASLGNGISLPNANAGMMSVRPQIAGTAAGIGAALMVAGGSVLAMLAGRLLTPGAGSGVLLGLLAASALASLLATLALRRR